jgi:peroxiredoxin
MTLADLVSQAPIGYSVGERIPDFQLTLVDGTTFSAQDLISEGRPVFLFFTASW